jgi:signal transduction histidine kinase
MNMQTAKYSSLGDQVSRKISIWVAILIASVIVAIMTVSFIFSRQMFNNQVSIWNAMVPQQILTNLLDSDHYSVEREVDFLKSTGLFSSVIITDNNKKVIAHFGRDDEAELTAIPIKDKASVVWGYYFFRPDFYRFIYPFIVAVAIFSILICLVYFVISWRLRSTLRVEFSRFNHFLSGIDELTEQLHAIYNDDSLFEIDLKTQENSEQFIINKAINRLLDQIKKANYSLREAIILSEQRRFQEELTRTALQVVHDIGSPIAVLEIFHATTSTLPEESRVLMRSAISRIRDISHTLLRKAKKDFSSQSDDSLMPAMLYFIIDQVVSEKRVQYRNLDIDFRPGLNAYKIFSLVKPSDLCRVLSNLINNAAEAVEDRSKITVSLIDSGNEILIEVQDYGKGIPKEFIRQLGVLGKSYGKTDGTGMGLNHAINSIHDWGGFLNVQSEEGEGTNVQITLPKCAPPDWFISEITVMDGQTIVIIDDDQSIHSVWETRLKKCCLMANIDVHILHFYSPEEFSDWHITAMSKSSDLYLCDYEFPGSSSNGIDLIKQLKISCQSVLVTSSVSDVMGECESSHIKLLPKSIASEIIILSK